MAAHQFVVKAKENSVSGGNPMVTGSASQKDNFLPSAFRQMTPGAPERPTGSRTPTVSVIRLAATLGFSPKAHSLSITARWWEVLTRARPFSPSAPGWK